MSRYIEPLKTIDGNKPSPAYYASAIPRSIPEETLPFYYETKQGDRLDNISTLFYGTPNNWWVIAQANKLTNGTLAINAGTILRIPNL
jgi:nucleoid-associated protein YgaU